MAAVAVQTNVSSQGVTIFTGTAIAFLSNVTTGNSIVVAVANGATATTFGASDATNGAYTNAVNSSVGGQSRSAAILYKHNVTGGSITVTVTSSVTGNGTIAIYEVSGLDAAGTVLSGSAASTTTPTAHVMSSVGLSGTGFVACAAQTNVNVTVTGLNVLYTESGTGSRSRVIFRGVGTFSSDQGSYTTAAANDRGAMALFPESAAAPGAITNLAATAITSTRVDLTWTAATGATSHRVERATVP